MKFMGKVHISDDTVMNPMQSVIEKEKDQKLVGVIKAVDPSEEEEYYYRKNREFRPWAPWTW